MKPLHVASLILRIATWLAVLAAPGVVVLERLALTKIKIWDDSYMFVRYADHLLSTGQALWNVDAEPTYGATSLLYIPVVAGMRLLFPDNPVAAAYSASLICGVAFLSLIIILIEYSCEATPTSKLALAIFVFLSVYCARNNLAVHFESGMDTCFAMAWLTLYMFSATLWQKAATTWRAVAVIILAGGAYSVRPDLVLLTLAVPLTVCAYKWKTGSIRNPLAAFLGASTLIACQMLVFQLYFGTAVPLAFYAKSMRLYSDTIYVVYQLTPFDQFFSYLADCAPLVIAAVVGFIFTSRRNSTRADPVAVALFLSAIVFITYYLFFVLQIMGYNARFYYPTYPVLLFLGAKGFSRIASGIEEWGRGAFPAKPRGAMVGLIVALSIAIVGLTAAATALSVVRVRNTPSVGSNFDLTYEYRKRWTYNWAELDQFSKLPDDVSIAATEIGRVAALNPGKKVYDLTGLNDAAIALKGFNADRFLADRAPDLLYMPHPHYTVLQKRILDSPEFSSRYRYYSPYVLQTRFGVAIRKSSKRFGEMATILDKRVNTLQSGKGK